MASIKILVTHEEDTPIAKTVEIPLIRLIEIETKCATESHQLCVFQELSRTHITDIEDLATQWENPVSLTSCDFEPGDCQGFGAVTLGDDETAIECFVGPRPMSILQLRDIKPP